MKSTDCYNTQNKAVQTGTKNLCCKNLEGVWLHETGRHPQGRYLHFFNYGGYDFFTEIECLHDGRFSCDKVNVYLIENGTINYFNIKYLEGDEYLGVKNLHDRLKAGYYEYRMKIGSPYIDCSLHIDCSRQITGSPQITGSALSLDLRSTNVYEAYRRIRVTDPNSSPVPDTVINPCRAYIKSCLNGPYGDMAAESKYLSKEKTGLFIYLFFTALCISSAVLIPKKSFLQIVLMIIAGFLAFCLIMGLPDKVKAYYSQRKKVKGLRKHMKKFTDIMSELHKSME